MPSTSPSPSPSTALEGDVGEEAQVAALCHHIEVMVVLAFRQIQVIPDHTLSVRGNQISQP
jgi:hypothetical protein